MLILSIIIPIILLLVLLFNLQKRQLLLTLKYDFTGYIRDLNFLVKEINFEEKNEEYKPFLDIVKPISILDTIGNTADGIMDDFVPVEDRKTLIEIMANILDGEDKILKDLVKTYILLNITIYNHKNINSFTFNFILNNLFKNKGNSIVKKENKETINQVKTREYQGTLNFCEC